MEGNKDTGANSAELEKQRRREEIMRRVEERKRKKLEISVSGGEENKNESVEEIFMVSQSLSRNNTNNQPDFEEEKRKLLSEILDFKSLLNKKDDEIQKLQKLLQESQNKVEPVKEDFYPQLKKLEEELATESKQIEALQTAAKEEEKLISKKDKEIDKLKNEISLLLKVKDDSETEQQNESSNTKEIQLNQEITQLKEKIDEKEKSNVEKDSQISELLENEKQNLEEIQNLNELLDEKENIIAQLQKENEELQESLESQLNELESQNGLLEGQLASVEEVEKVETIRENNEVKIEGKLIENISVNDDVLNSINDISPDENPLIAQLLLEINELRSSPSVYSKKLQEKLDQYEGLVFKSKYVEGATITTKEGQNGLLEAIKYLENTPPVALLQYSRVLATRCKDVNRSNSRLDRYGNLGKVFEISNYGPLSNNAEDIVFQLIVDDGNPLRRQRDILLDSSFKEVGMHCEKKADYTAVIALSSEPFEVLEFLLQKEKKIYDPIAPGEAQLTETEDGSCFQIISEPFLVPKEDIKVYSRGKSLVLIVNKKSPEVVTITKQWALPFAVPVKNISACLNENSEVVINIKKHSEINNDIIVTSYSLQANPSCGDNRVQVIFEQQPNSILFITKACSCEVMVTLRIIEGMIFCFESVHKEIINQSGTSVTRTTTRKENIKMPFIVNADQITTKKSEDFVTITVQKPNGNDKEEEIPLS